MTLSCFSSASCAFYWFVLTAQHLTRCQWVLFIVWAERLHFHYGVSFLFLYDVGRLMIWNKFTCIRKLEFGLWGLFKQLDLRLTTPEYLSQMT